MTKDSSGILVYFDDVRRQDLIQAHSDGSFESFSDALNVRDWKIGQFNVALLSFSRETIDFIAVARKGNRVATVRHRVEFDAILDLGAVNIGSIESGLNTRIKEFFINASSGTGGVLPSEVWSEVIRLIKVARPGLTEEIDRVLSISRFSGMRLKGPVAEVFLLEREAVGISFDIFSGGNILRERVLGEWVPIETSVVTVDNEESSANLLAAPIGHSSFLNGISSRYLQEESALQHDLYNWPGMSVKHSVGVSVFEQGSRRLEIIYANRNALEETTGVDLIYYNECYEQFVLVQYKLMQEEGSSMVYRPNAQLEIELERMDHLYAANQVTTAIESQGHYRLNDDGFMLKLVPNRGLLPATGELIKGMYIPRQYMHFLIGSHGPKGPKGGCQITFENTYRYMTNSEFAANVNRGWIGTRGFASHKIKEILIEYFEGPRSVILSYETAKQSRGSRN